MLLHFLGIYRFSRPFLPEGMSAAVCAFPTVTAAVDSVIEAIQCGIPIARVELLDALKRVSILVEQKSQRTFFNLSTNTIVLSTEEGEIGTAREEIPCSYDGEDTMMALNCKYVEEPLKAMKTEVDKLHAEEEQADLVIVEIGMITPPIGMNVFVLNSVVRDVPLSAGRRATGRGGIAWPLRKWRLDRCAAALDRAGRGDQAAFLMVREPAGEGAGR